MRRNGYWYALCLLVLSAQSQEFRGTLTGRVVDPSGAAIPNIKVTLTNNDNGARSETATTTEGEYTIPFLAPGPYQVVVDAPGFKRYVQERIQIGTNQRVTQEITLQVGAQTELVTITADAPMLSTSTAAVDLACSTTPTGPSVFSSLASTRKLRSPSKITT